MAKKKAHHRLPNNQPSLLAFWGTTKKNAVINKAPKATSKDSLDAKQATTQNTPLKVGETNDDNDSTNTCNRKNGGGKRKRLECACTPETWSVTDSGLDQFQHKAAVTPMEDEEKLPPSLPWNKNPASPTKHRNGSETESNDKLKPDFPADESLTKIENNNPLEVKKKDEQEQDNNPKSIETGSANDTKSGNANDSSESEDDEEEASDSATESEKEEPEHSTCKHYSEGLSEYELLRQRNIARNNARLRALGLLVQVEESSARRQAKPNKKSNRPKKRLKKGQSTVAPPTRRSTRLSRSSNDKFNTNKNETVEQETVNLTIAPQSTLLEAVKEEEVEQYDVSPLVQYDMEHPLLEQTNGLLQNQSANSQLPEKKDITTLVPTNHRLSPPQGLSHIYSLNFYKHDNNWLVGAGKAGIVALWNCRQQNVDQEDNVEASNCSSIHYSDPVFSWKAHGGRWVSEAQFLPNNNNSNTSTTSTCGSTSAPSRLLTAANDGTVCLWDLSQVSTTTGVPKILQRSDKTWHSSGIFAMDVNTNTAGGDSSKVVTGSKDKTVVVASIRAHDGEICPVWRSEFHTKTVKAVKFRDQHVLATASDDGCVALLDDRLDSSEASPPVGLLEGLHDGKPHSVLFDLENTHLFLTAGLDTDILAWDMRYLKQQDKHPVCTYYGHVPLTTRRCKRIHHPFFYSPTQGTSKHFILTGGEGSHSLSMFQHSVETLASSSIAKAPVFSRGVLPKDCNHGDVGSIAIRQDTVAASVEGGEILMLAPC